jgi:hypothetical protein
MKRSSIIALAVLLATPFASFAQEFRATISGAVTDPTGAPVPSAQVTATAEATGIKSQATTDTSGNFTIPFLLPGAYDLTASAPGFESFTRAGIHLSAGEHSIVDVHLQVGAQSQTVRVTADIPLVDTANASAGQTITTKQVEDLPVNGRTPLMLAQLSMGVIPEGQPSLVHPFDNAGATDFSIAGSRIQSSEVLMDGSPDTTWDLRVAYNPPMDAVQQVTVDIFNSDAAYGHTSAGTANQITKSGTNQFHGSLYEFNQNNFTSANNFFSNASGKPVPTLHYNQYGITAGAPVIIPKVFNGKDKVFWFFAYEGLRDNTPTPITTTVPTAAERNGDFSQLLSLGKNYQIYNPYNGVLSGTTITRGPFINNKLPGNLINPISQAYLNYYPQPNTAGLPNGEDNYFVNAASIDNFDNEFGRLDFNLSNNDKMFFDFRHNNRLQDKNNLFNNIATGSYLTRENWGATLDEVHTFSGTTVGDLRLNWTRMDELHSEPSAGFNPTALGFPDLIASQSEHIQMPMISFGSCGSYTSFQCLGDTGASSLPSDNYSIFGDVEKVVGSHTLKFGVDARRYDLSDISYGAAAGSFTFGTNWTQGPTSTSAAAPLGQEFASFLLGLPTSGSYNEASYAYLSSYYYGLFINDDWRVKPNFTLNLGLRVEQETGLAERYGRIVNGFDGTAPNPIASAAQTAYGKNYATYLKDCAALPAYCPPAPNAFAVNGGLTFGSPGSPDIYPTPGVHLSPRIGFSWSPSVFHNKTVIRAGFGIFVAPLFSTALTNIPASDHISTSPIVNQEGFSQSTSFTATNNNYLSPENTLSNPFPQILLPVGSANGLATFVGQSVSFLSPAMRNPYSERWEFDIQQQLSDNLMLEIGYIGNRSIDIPIEQTERNMIPRQYLSTSAYRDAADNAIATVLGASVPNPFQNLMPGGGSLNGKTVALQQLLAPFPEFPVEVNGGSVSGGVTGVVEQNNTAGASWYNSLNVRLEKRYSSGLFLIANYAYSKMMEQVDYLNDTDLAPETRTSLFDHPHHIALAFSYEFPFGHGRTFDLHNRWANAIAGGWVVNGIYQWEIGAPIYFPTQLVYCPTPSPACNGFGGPLDVNNSNGNGQAFNLAAFDLKSTDQPTDNIRTFPTTFGNVRQENLNELDASLLKNFNFTESAYFQLRFETFNVLNHPVFDTPNVSNPTSTTFGLIQTQANMPRSIQLGARLVW